MHATINNLVKLIILHWFIPLWKLGCYRNHLKKSFKICKRLNRAQPRWTAERRSLALFRPGPHAEKSSSHQCQCAHTCARVPIRLAVSTPFPHAGHAWFRPRVSPIRHFNRSCTILTESHLHMRHATPCPYRLRETPSRYFVRHRHLLCLSSVSLRDVAPSAVEYRCRDLSSYCFFLACLTSSSQSSA
jgi:hypothetical protein